MRGLKRREQLQKAFASFQASALTKLKVAKKSIADAPPGQGMELTVRTHTTHAHAYTQTYAHICPTHTYAHICPKHTHAHICPYAHT